MDLSEVKLRFSSEFILYSTALVAKKFLKPCTETDTMKEGIPVKGLALRLPKVSLLLSLGVSCEDEPTGQ